MTIYREYPCDIVVYMKFYGNPFQLCSDKWVWNKPYFDLLPYSHCDIYHCTSFSISSSSRFFTSTTTKKQFSPAVSNVEVGCERAPNYASWGGLQITVTSAKNCLLFLDFFPILLVYFCNLTHLHTTVWCESCQSCFF